LFQERVKQVCRAVKARKQDNACFALVGQRDSPIASTRICESPVALYLLAGFGGSSRMKDHDTSATWPLS
jgi:hypothetical protein